MAVRIDKFLWSVRVFKTRTQAGDACKAGKVTIDGKAVKPAKEISTGVIIDVKKDHINRRYKVLNPIQKRVGAKLVENFVLDITPQSELDKLQMLKQNFEYRERGLGRPTKRDRRIITKIKKGYEY